MTTLKYPGGRYRSKRLSTNDATFTEGSLRGFGGALGGLLLGRRFSTCLRHCPGGDLLRRALSVSA